MAVVDPFVDSRLKEPVAAEENLVAAVKVGLALLGFQNYDSGSLGFVLLLKLDWQPPAVNLDFVKAVAVAAGS